MQWSDYKETKHHKRISVGVLDHTYVITEQKQGCMDTYFYPISKEEHDSFDNWKDDETKIQSLYETEPIYIGYYLTNEMRKYEKKSHRV